MSRRDSSNLRRPILQEYLRTTARSDGPNIPGLLLSSYVLSVFLGSSLQPKNLDNNFLNVVRTFSDDLSYLNRRDVAEDEFDEYFKYLVGMVAKIFSAGNRSDEFSGLFEINLVNQMEILSATRDVCDSLRRIEDGLALNNSLRVLQIVSSADQSKVILDSVSQISNVDVRRFWGVDLNNEIYHRNRRGNAALNRTAVAVDRVDNKSQNTTVSDDISAALNRTETALNRVDDRLSRIESLQDRAEESNRFVNEVLDDVQNSALLSRGEEVDSEGQAPPPYGSEIQEGLDVGLIPPSYEEATNSDQVPPSYEESIREVDVLQDQGLPSYEEAVGEQSNLAQGELINEVLDDVQNDDPPSYEESVDSDQNPPAYQENQQNWSQKAISQGRGPGSQDQSWGQKISRIPQGNPSVRQ